MAVTLVACNTDEQQSVGEPIPFGFASIDEARRVLGDYAGVFDNVDGSLYVGTTDYALVDQQTYSVDAQVYDPMTARSRSVGELSIGSVRFDFDNTTLSYVPSIPTGTDQYNSTIKSWLGTTIPYSYLNELGEKVVSNVYVPKPYKVSLLNGKQNDFSNVPSFGRSGVDLTFDVDPLVTRGTVVYALWTGTTSTSDPRVTAPNSTLAERAILIQEKEGQLRLPSSLFEGMPKDAIVSVWLLRGDIHVENLPGVDRKMKVYSLVESKFAVHLVD